MYKRGALVKLQLNVELGYGSDILHALEEWNFLNSYVVKTGKCPL
jgi:hypothetical protein